MIMTVHEVLYRLTWQVAGYPENSVIGKHSSITLVRDLLMARGIDKIELRVMEATSARLPAPGAESTERVDRAGRSRPGGRHAAPRAAEAEARDRDDEIDPDAMRRLARRALRPDPRDVSSGNGTEFS
jgi:hypothetical protein